MTPREIDALVAEKVMGCDVVGLNPGSVYWGKPECMKDEHSEHQDIAFYSTDIAAAWEVVNKMRSAHNWDFELVVTDGGAHARFKGMHLFAETAPTAICLAALRAVGVAVDS